MILGRSVLSASPQYVGGPANDCVCQQVTRARCESTVRRRNRSRVVMYRRKHGLIGLRPPAHPDLVSSTLGVAAHVAKTDGIHAPSLRQCCVSPTHIACLSSAVKQRQDRWCGRGPGTARSAGLLLLWSSAWDGLACHSGAQRPTYASRESHV